MQTYKAVSTTAATCAQDFEALTPNLLARTIETVEGGGIVVLLLSSMQSLTRLFSLTMDVHSRLRTDSHQDVTGAAPALTPQLPPATSRGLAVSLGAARNRGWLGQWCGG